MDRRMGQVNGSYDRRTVTILKKEWRRNRDVVSEIIENSPPDPAGLYLDQAFDRACRSHADLYEELRVAILKVQDHWEEPNAMDEKEYLEDILSLCNTEFSTLQKEYEGISSTRNSGGPAVPFIKNLTPAQNQERTGSSNIATLPPRFREPTCSSRVNPPIVPHRVTNSEEPTCTSREIPPVVPHRVTNNEAQLAELTASIELEKKAIELHELKLRREQLENNVNAKHSGYASSSQEGDSTWGYHNGREYLINKNPPPPGTSIVPQLSPISAKHEHNMQQNFACGRDTGQNYPHTTQYPVHRQELQNLGQPSESTPAAPLFKKQNILANAYAPESTSPRRDFPLKLNTSGRNRSLNPFLPDYVPYTQPDVRPHDINTHIPRLDTKNPFQREITLQQQRPTGGFPPLYQSGSDSFYIRKMMTDICEEERFDGTLKYFPTFKADMARIKSTVWHLDGGPAIMLECLFKKCKGEVLLAIEHYRTSNNEAADYHRAMQDLEELYGGDGNLVEEEIKHLIRKDRKGWNEQDIRALLIEMNSCEYRIANTGKSYRLNSEHVISSIIGNRLPKRTVDRLVMEMSMVQRLGDLPNFSELKEFIRGERCHIASKMVQRGYAEDFTKKGRTVNPAKNTNKPLRQNAVEVTPPSTALLTTGVKQSPEEQKPVGKGGKKRGCPAEACPLRYKHRLYQCPIFKEMKLPDRWNMVKNNELCFGCLGQNHSVAECYSDRRCDNCGKKHNKYLCDNPPKKIDENAASIEEAEKKTELVSGCMALRTKDNKYLPVVPIEVFSEDTGKSQEIVMLIDSGADTTMTTFGVASHLGLSGPKEVVTVHGANGAE